MNREDLKLGQKYLIVGGFRKPTSMEGEVVKIGRKYVYFRIYAQDVPFDIETQREKETGGSTAYLHRFMSEQQYQDERKRAWALKELLDVWRIKDTGYTRWREYSTDTLVAICDLLEDRKKKGIL